VRALNSAVIVLISMPPTVIGWKVTNQNRQRREAARIAAAEQLSLNDRLESQAEEVVDAHNAFNTSKKDLADQRKKFFDLADEFLANDEYPLDQIVLVRPTGMSEDEVEEWVAASHPEYRITHVSDEDVTIEEDPSKRKFAWLLDDLGLKVERGVRRKGQTLDTAALHRFCTNAVGRAKDASMYEAVLDCLVERTVYDFDEKKFSEVLDEHPAAAALIQSYLSKGRIETPLTVGKITEGDYE
jgi:hypothetical protein